MLTSLGIGPYELDRPGSPSVQKARSLFLRLLDGFTLLPTSEKVFKSDAPASLYRDVFLSFTVLVLERYSEALFSKPALSPLTSDTALFLHLKRTITPEEVEEFLPNHLALQRKSPATHIELQHWADKWSLDCDWCLDFAVEAMRVWLFNRYAREFRLWEPAIKSDTSSLIWDAVMEHVIEEEFKGRFSFEFENVNLSAASWNYRLEEATEWRSKVTSELLLYLKSIIDQGETLPPGTLSRIVNRFEKEVEAHIRKAETEIKEQGYKQVAQVRGEAQFAWTVCYQVMGYSYSEVCREFNQPRRTVTDGIDYIIKLIGLKKRHTRRGRKPGVPGDKRNLLARVEANKKMRLRRFIAALAQVADPENKADVARAIGISAYHFRREWVPYLISETGCKDYFSLIRKYRPVIQ